MSGSVNSAKESTGRKSCWNSGDRSVSASRRAVPWEIQGFGAPQRLDADRRQPAFRLYGFTEQQLLETLFFANGFCSHGHAAALSQS